MRVLAGFYCVLLACIALTQATDTEDTRPKRHLSLINDFLSKVVRPIVSLKGQVIHEKLKEYNSAPAVINKVPITPFIEANAFINPVPIVKPAVWGTLPCPPLPVRYPARHLGYPPLHFVPAAPLRRFPMFPQRMGPILPRVMAPIRPPMFGGLVPRVLVPVPPPVVAPIPPPVIAPIPPRIAPIPPRIAPIPPPVIAPIPPRFAPIPPPVVAPVLPPIAPIPQPMVAPPPPMVAPPAPLPRPVVPVPRPIMIPSFKYIYNQENQDGSITTFYSKDGKDVLVTNTDATPRIPPPVLLERVMKIVKGVPFTPMIPGPVPLGPLPRPLPIGPPPLAIQEFPAPIRPILTPLPEIMAPLITKARPFPYIDIRNKSFGNPLSIPSPTQIVDRIENIEASNNKGYSFKLTNEEGYLKQGDEKIYYSRLLPSPYYSPAPLSVYGSDARRKPNQYTVITEDIPIFDGIEEGSMIRKHHYGASINKLINSREPAGAIYENPLPFGHIPPMPNPYFLQSFPIQDDVTVQVNKHEHVRPDGTTYICYDKHEPRLHPVLPLGTKELFYGPRRPISEMPSFHKIATKEEQPQAINRSNYKYSTVNLERVQSSTTQTPMIDSSKTTPLLLSQNPIVVMPPDQKFSYKVNKADGSYIDVSSGQDNKISVKVSNGIYNDRRGDVPEDFS